MAKPKIIPSFFKIRLASEMAKSLSSFFFADDKEGHAVLLSQHNHLEIPIFELLLSVQKICSLIYSLCFGRFVYVLKQALPNERDVLFLASHSEYFPVPPPMSIIFEDEVGIYFSMSDLILSNSNTPIPLSSRVSSDALL